MSKRSISDNFVNDCALNQSQSMKNGFCFSEKGPYDKLCNLKKLGLRNPVIF